MLLRPGDLFANCRILSLCGSGGMGVVYFAEDMLHRKVALKIVAVSNAERELRGIQQYIHAVEKIPSMIRIFHAGIEQGQLVYIMEAADSLNPPDLPYTPKTLAAILKQQGKIPPNQALKIIRYLGEGLSQLHEAHLIHRDIKPENIIFVNCMPKFCDPGLVCEQDSSVSFAGTLGYLPHECFKGDNLNTPSRDLYALGMVFYVAVTGEVPFRYPRLPFSLHVAAQKKLWPLIVRVCNSNPQRRFASVADFLDALPKKMPDPNWFDKINESFREYQLLHPRFYFRSMVTALVILLCVIGLSAYQVHQSRIRAVYLEKCRKECRLFERKLNNMESLCTQIEAQKGAAELKKFKASFLTLPEDPAARLRQLQTVEKELRELALQMIPSFPETTDDGKAELLSSGVRSLLSSPLGDWLPKEKRKELEKKIEPLEQRHITKQTRLQAGKKYYPLYDYSLCFVYVPAGVYRDKQGKIIRISHAFWCSDAEISSTIFSRICGDKWLLANRELPQVKFCWNDLLDLCRAMTIKYQKAGFLPEGFIIRPMTTQEWYWVFRNAWSGVQKQQSEERIRTGKAQPVYTGIPNKLGVYNMEGNVSEITLPVEEEKAGNCVYICGASHSNKISSEPPKKKFLKFQHFAPFVGSRLAVVRGSLDFFEREHWYMEDSPLEWNGRIYQCIVGNSANFTQQCARNFCDLLGGHLSAPDDPDLRKEMKKAFFESANFPFAVDAVVKDGKLVTSVGKPYRFIPAPKNPPKNEMMLCLYNNTIRFGPDVKCCGFLCDWSKEEYEQRTNLDRILKNRCIAHTFRIGDKVYALVMEPAIIFPIRQVAMFLGGRLAEPATPEICERMKEELAPWKHQPIFIGGKWKFGRWVLSDGTKLRMDLKHRGLSFSNSFNVSSPGLQNGEFCALQKAQGFLLEFPVR